jgi:DNA-binding PadR family transcriptional regulator
MPLPDVSHLQYLILAALLNGSSSGRQVREFLASHGEKKSGPAFYQLMARMEDAKFVTGKYEQKIVEGQIIKERIYEPTGGGVAAFEATRDFYAALSNASRLVTEGV